MENEDSETRKWLRTHLRKRQHMTSDVPLCKAGSSISEEILPFSFKKIESGLVSQLGVSVDKHVCCEVRLEASAPFA